MRPPLNMANMRPPFNMPNMRLPLNMPNMWLPLNVSGRAPPLSIPNIMPILEMSDRTPILNMPGKRPPLTPSLPCHLKTTSKCAKSETLKPFCLLLFALACERIFIKTHSTESRYYRTGRYTLCGRVRASLSPAEKGLNILGRRPPLNMPRTG